MSDERRSIPDRRKPGRPREFRDPSEVSFMLEGELHEQIAQEARRRGDVSLSSVIRDLIAWALKHQERTSTN